MSDPLEYQTSDTPTAPAKRGAAGWTILLIVWTIGIAVWAAYLFVIATVLIRIL
jgi:hypothetical protein